FPSVALPEAPAPGLRMVRFHLQKAEYLSMDGEWRQQETDRLRGRFEVKLAKGLELGGIVFDEKGKPVPKAEILVDHQMSLLLGENDVQADAGTLLFGFKWLVPPGTWLARTDSNGRWSARCSHPGIKWASFRVRHPDFADAVYSTELTRAMEL